MKNLLFAALILVSTALAYACGFLQATRRPPEATQDVDGQRLREQERDQLAWNLRIVQALNQGKVDQVRDWANGIISLWIISRCADARAEPFPSAKDDRWDIDFVAQVAAERARHPVDLGSQDANETLNEALSRASRMKASPE